MDKVFTAATHYQSEREREESNTRSDATLWAHGVEWQRERTFDQNSEMELRKANNETIPILPNQLGKKVGHCIKQALVQIHRLTLFGPHGCYVKQLRVENLHTDCCNIYIRNISFRLTAYVFNYELSCCHLAPVWSVICSVKVPSTDVMAKILLDTLWTIALQFGSDKNHGKRLFPL